MNKKGFTLIELLAVVVILGIIMAIAIPSVSSIITNSKKKTYIDSAKGYISAAKVYASDHGGRGFPTEDNPISKIMIKDLDVDRYNGRDDFDKKLIEEKCFVSIRNSFSGYEFYISLLDEDGIALDNVLEDDLTVDSIKYNVSPDEIKDLEIHYSV